MLRYDEKAKSYMEKARKCTKRIEQLASAIVANASGPSSRRVSDPLPSPAKNVPELSSDSVPINHVQSTRTPSGSTSTKQTSSSSSAVRSTQPNNNSRASASSAASQQKTSQSSSSNRPSSSNWTAQPLSLASLSNPAKILNVSTRYTAVTDKKPRSLLYNKDLDILVTSSLDGYVQITDLLTQVKVDDINTHKLLSNRWCEEMCWLGPEMLVIASNEDRNDEVDAQLSILYDCSFDRKNGNFVRKVSRFLDKFHDKGIATLCPFRNEGVFTGGLDRKIKLIKFQRVSNSADSKGRIVLFKVGSGRIVGSVQREDRINAIVPIPGQPNLKLISSSSKAIQHGIFDDRSQDFVLNFGVEELVTPSKYTHPFVHPDGYLIGQGQSKDAGRGEDCVQLWDVRYSKVSSTPPMHIKMHDERILRGVFTTSDMLVTLGKDRKLGFTSFNVNSNP
ncbi:hypothetical protein HK102_006473 [Quaeritorhiza haematococci]|nr:hypothetical protein HK102_006473 [Quaeritorhiza haematococci]